MARHSQIPGRPPEGLVAGPEDAAGYVAGRVAEGADYIKIIIDLRGRGAAANAAGRDLDAARCRGHPVGGPSRRRQGMPMPHSGEKELPKHEVLVILRRLGISPATIEAIDREVGDPVQLERDGAILANHGVTRDLLISRMGGSP